MDGNISQAIELLIEEGAKREQFNAGEKIIQVLDETIILYRGQMTRLKEHNPPAPETLELSTLDGLIEFIMADVDKAFTKPDEPCIVHVAGPSKVVLKTPITGIEKKRNVLAISTYAPPRIRYNEYLDAEELGIMVQTNFLQDANRDLLLRVVFNLTESQTMQSADDGVSQRLVVKKGIEATGETTFKNPAYLCPYRTFPEVEQPASPFILRIQEKHSAALYIADGDAWRVEAVKNVAEYLRERLRDANVTVIS